MSGAAKTYPPGEAPGAEARAEAALERELKPDAAPLEISLDEAPAEPRSVQRGAEAIREFWRHAPAGPGVYRMIGAEGEVLYVGKARSIKKRIAAYIAPERQPTRIARMVAQTHAMVFVTTETEAEALLLEANLIKQLKPRYNVVLRDDKSFPYILICTGHPAARLLKHRGARTSPGDYFGPFASAGAVFRTLNALQRAFLLRTCSDSYYDNRTRPCLLYQIKRCSAPCTGEIGLGDYAKLVGEARDFLSGRSRAVRQRLAEEMAQASDALDFEKAARLRDRISALSAIQGEQSRQSALDSGGGRVRGLRGGGAISASRRFSSAPIRTGATAPIFRAPTAALGPEEVLDAFLAQFYLERPAPRLVLLSHDVPSAEALCRGPERARRPSHRHRRAAARREEGARRRRDAQCARGAVAQARRKRASQEKLLAALAGGLRRRAADPARRGLRQFAHHGDERDRRHGRRGAGGVREEPVPHVQHQERGPDARRRLRDDARGADPPLRPARSGRARRRRRAAFPIRPISSSSTAAAGSSRPRARSWPSSASTGVALAAIAKGPDRNAGRETFFVEGREPFRLSPARPALYFVQRLRDEAHRFAIGTHRAKRKREFVKNPLDEIPGIGPARKRALLYAFGSAKAVARAGLVRSGKDARPQRRDGEGGVRLLP